MSPEIVRWIKIVVLKTLRERNLVRLDISTLISSGMLGYTQALRRYDPNRGVKFKTFAEYRIKGAVLDEVRKMIGDERSKTPRPRRVEDFDYTALTDEGFGQESIESSIDFATFVQLVALSERELSILHCRMNGMNLREISKEFGFSESRASQLLAKIKKVVYVWYREQMGLQFGLVSHVCPACQNENCISDKLTEFRCDICDVPLMIRDSVPIMSQEPKESVDNEEGYPRNCLHSG